MNRNHLTRDQMLRAVGMLENGARQNDVAEAFQTTQSVISRLWARYREHGDVSERHPGPSRITTPAQDRFLSQMARRNPRITAPELMNRFRETHNVQISESTIRNRLHESGLRSRRPLRCQPLSRGNRAARLNWVTDHENWTENQWAPVLFTDESRFGLHPDSRRVRVWRETGLEAVLENVREVHSYRGGTVMVWAGIRLGGRTNLILLENFLTAQRYMEEILRPVVLPQATVVGPRFILMHDNARPHVARIVTDFLQEQEITVLPWPAQSPDLNPIEHAWDMLQRRVLRVHQNFENRAQLFTALSDAWDALPQNELDNLILSMGRRCRAVRNARGGHTRY